MSRRLKKTLATVGVLAAFGLGGAVIAQGGTATPPASSPGGDATVQEHGATKGQAVQEQSDRTDSEKGEKADGKGKDDVNDTEGADEVSGKQDDQPSSEKRDGDGPGGHADEPGDSSADHQAEGQE